MHYKTELRRKLRRNQTKAESILWYALRAKKFFGLKFRRQHSIGKYIVDFYCAQFKLVIEVDGSSHDNIVKQEYDFHRSAWIVENGYFIMNFRNEEVYRDVIRILSVIEDYIEEQKTSLSDKGGHLSLKGEK